MSSVLALHPISHYSTRLHCISSTMSDHHIRLPPFAELISSATSPASITSTTAAATSPTTSNQSSFPRPYDSWVPPIPTTFVSDKPSTPPLLPAPTLQHHQRHGSAPSSSWQIANHGPPLEHSSPRLAPSPPHGPRALLHNNPPPPPPPNHHHHQQHNTPNQSPSLPFTPKSLEFPPNHSSPAPSQNTGPDNIRRADLKAPDVGSIIGRQDSVVPEPHVATAISRPHDQSRLHVSNSDFAPRFHEHSIPAGDRRNYDASAAIYSHYPRRPPSPAPSPEHVSPLSTSAQRRTTSPPISLNHAASAHSTRRSRSSSDPKLGTALLRTPPTSTRRVKSSSLLHGGQASHPSDQMQQHQTSSSSESSLQGLQPPVETTHDLDHTHPAVCRSCNAVWEVTRPAIVARNNVYTSGHDMINFAESMMHNATRHFKANEEKFAIWRSQHICNPDDDATVPCIAAQNAAAAAAATRNNKRKLEAPLDEGLVHAKLRRLSVDSPKASQLTPPPEPGSSSARTLLHKPHPGL